MTDYIKREDAINTVRNTFTGMTADTLELRIKGIPPADVAPVVRCKDCVWYVRSMIKQDGTLDKRYKPDWCDLYRRVREETYFCADGERKDDE